jgi:DNA-directed RNA polymerase subunit RPC12/RpoP
MDDFKRPDGNTDWASYEKAQIQNGETCSECKSCLIFPTGQPRICGSCKAMKEDKGEVSHDDDIRCPACRTTWDPRDTEDYDVLEDGEHDIRCPECDHEFTVSTSVSFTFTSPELIEKKPEAEKPETSKEAS